MTSMRKTFIGSTQCIAINHVCLDLLPSPPFFLFFFLFFFFVLVLGTLTILATTEYSVLEIKLSLSLSQPMGAVVKSTYFTFVHMFFLRSIKCTIPFVNVKVSQMTFIDFYGCQWNKIIFFPNYLTKGNLR